MGPSWCGVIIYSIPSNQLYDKFWIWSLGSQNPLFIVWVTFLSVPKGCWQGRQGRQGRVPCVMMMGWSPGRWQRPGHTHLFVPGPRSLCNGILMSDVDNDEPVLELDPHSSLLLRTFCHRTMFSLLLYGPDKKCKVRVESRVDSGNVGRLWECEQSCKFGAV